MRSNPPAGDPRIGRVEEPRLGDLAGKGLASGQRHGPGPQPPLDQVLDCIPLAILVTDGAGIVSRSNRHAARMFAAPGSLEGTHLEALLPGLAGGGTAPAAWFAPERQAARGMLARRLDGATMPVETHIAAFTSDALYVVVVTARDQTDERNQAETHAALEKLVAEKQVMLQEIHHRVKNNLQVVASLLNLQGQYAGDSRTRELFNDSRNRIRSIALVHEKLYRSQDLSKVDLRDYLEDLVKEMRRFYPKGQTISIAVRAPPLAVDVDAAINCGLIVSELVSNSLKHAFPAGRVGTVRVSVTPADRGRIRIFVADDGIGMPGAFHPESGTTLGMQLVWTLVQQMDGTIIREPGPGTSLALDLDAQPRGSATSAAADVEGA